MSKHSLPDIFGLQRLQVNGGAVAPQRKVLNLLGEVALEDNPARRRIDAIVGAPAIITPPPLTASVADYAPDGFATASIVRVAAIAPGLAIDGLQVAGIRTLRRTWVNVGEFSITLVSGATLLPSSLLLDQGRAVAMVFDPVSEAWIMRPLADGGGEPPSGDPSQFDFSGSGNSQLLPLL